MSSWSDKRVWIAGGTGFLGRVVTRRLEQMGCPAVRATGETSWAVRGIPGCDRLLEYEARLNTALETVPVTAVCQYDVNLFDGGTILDVLRVHPIMISRGQLVKNPFYVGPEEFLANRRPARA